MIDESEILAILEIIFHEELNDHEKVELCKKIAH